MKEWLLEFVSRFADEAQSAWEQVPIDPTLGRAHDSAVLTFYAHAGERCGALPALLKARPPRVAGGATREDRCREVLSVLRDLLKVAPAIRKQAEALNAGTTKGKRKGKATRRDAEEWFPVTQLKADIPQLSMVEDDVLAELVLTWFVFLDDNVLSDDEILRSAADKLQSSDRYRTCTELRILESRLAKAVKDRTSVTTILDDFEVEQHKIQHYALAARDVLRGFEARDEEPSEADWETLADLIVDQSKIPTWCSLIYIYWLDEGGLFLTVERLADRIENGMMGTAQLLQAVRVEEGSDVARVMNAYLTAWQRGDLAAVDERRRQYEALYGFPLHVAARWGRLVTVDPRQGFPASFHRFLSEAMRYYRDRRNKQVIADPQAARAAFGPLAEALQEGNENLRRVVTPELRAQAEYTKRVLGGAGNPPSLADSWQKALPGRPGIRDAVKPWQYAVDSVATLLRWKRPSIKDYLTLAENGETILVVARQFLQAQDPTDGVWRAFLHVIQEPIQRYVSAYKTVARIDLVDRPYLGPPADAIARSVKPPVIPPLRRNWASEVLAPTG